MISFDFYSISKFLGLLICRLIFWKLYALMLNTLIFSRPAFLIQLRIPIHEEFTVQWRRCCQVKPSYSSLFASIFLFHSWDCIIIIKTYLKCLEYLWQFWGWIIQGVYSYPGTFLSIDSKAANRVSPPSLPPCEGGKEQHKDTNKAGEVRVKFGCTWGAKFHLHTKYEDWRMTQVNRFDQGVECGWSVVSYVRHFTATRATLHSRFCCYPDRLNPGTLNITTGKVHERRSSRLRS